MVIPKKPLDGKEVFNASEACFHIGLSWNTLKKLINEGEIRVVRVGRRYLIPKTSLDEFLHGDKLLAQSILKAIR
jgi:excisionase family DNA binding protein